MCIIPVLALQTKNRICTGKPNGIKNTIEISDVGSGLNFKKRGFLKLLKLLFQGKILSIVVTPKDRLMHFEFALLDKICQYLNVTIIVLQNNDTEPDFTTQLTLDLVEIITVFSAKLYGLRSAQNRIKDKAILVP